MSTWFEGTQPLDCTLADISGVLEYPGEHYTRMVAHMPGMSQVELVDHGESHVTIRTNEGLMRRSNLVIQRTDESIVVELDEEYQAGTKVTVESHFREEFTQSEGGVSLLLTISDVTATGILGFFYRMFGSRSMGKAFLGSYREVLSGNSGT